MYFLDEWTYNLANVSTNNATQNAAHNSVEKNRKFNTKNIGTIQRVDSIYILFLAHW